MSDEKAPVVPIEFSRWVRWRDRNNLPERNRCGVYLLARFPNTLPVATEQADPFADHVIYIGESCTSLAHRWRQFHRSAFEGKFGHSGGATYREKYRDPQNGRCDDGADLWVSAFVPPVTLDQDKWSFFIKYVERKLIWDYVWARSRAPVCNRE
jgi:hypothetical protein